MLSSKEKGHKDKLLQNIPSRYVKNCSSGHVIIYDLRFWALHVIDVSMVQVFFCFSALKGTSTVNIEASKKVVQMSVLLA